MVAGFITSAVAGGSGAGFHAHEEAFCIVVKGSKRWFIQLQDSKMAPGEDIRVLHDPTAEARQRWLTDVLPSIANDTGTNKPLECWQDAGDVLYIPAWLNHAVWNHGDTTVGLSVTHLKVSDAEDSHLGSPCWSNPWQDHCAAV